MNSGDRQISVTENWEFVKIDSDNDSDKSYIDLNKVSISKRITSFSIGKLSSSLIRENMCLKDDLSECNEERFHLENKYQREKNLLKACGVIILIQVGIIYVLIGKII